MFYVCNVFEGGVKTVFGTLFELFPTGVSGVGWEEEWLSKILQEGGSGHPSPSRSNGVLSDGGGISLTLKLENVKGAKR